MNADDEGWPFNWPEPEKREAKIFWPIKEGDCPSVADAYETLYSLSYAELEVTFFDETGNVETDELIVDFIDCYADKGDGGFGGVFARMPLKKMLEEKYAERLKYYDEDNRTRLLSRLIKAFDEPA